MSSREAIFADLRRALGRSAPVDEKTRADLDRRDSTIPDDAKPQVDGDLIERFMNRVIAGGASATRVRNPDDVVTAVEDFLKEHELSSQLVASTHPLVQRISWPESIAVETRSTAGDDPTSITGAVAALAETGSVVIASGEGTSTTLNFLSDNHIVLVETAQIGAHLEKVLHETRETGSMPRALNMITGPSKTADVEQVLQHGAHGPRRLHVIVVG